MGNLQAQQREDRRLLAFIEFSSSNVNVQNFDLSEGSSEPFKPDPAQAENRIGKERYAARAECLSSPSGESPDS